MLMVLRKRVYQEYFLYSTDNAGWLGSEGVLAGGTDCA